MIHKETRLFVADNSGAKIAQCINIPGGTKRKCARVGDKILVSIKDSYGDGKIKAGQMSSAVIVRMTKAIRRDDGSFLRFDDNAVVLINAAGEPIGTRVFGPIAREVKLAGYARIASLAVEVL